MKKTKKKNRYWVCIIGPMDMNKVPMGFDSVPRIAAINAIMSKGFKQPECWSGWGCTEEKFEKLMKVWNED